MSHRELGTVHPLEPQRLRCEEFWAAWLTLLYAGTHSVVRSRGLRAALGVLLLVATLPAAVLGWGYLSLSLVLLGSFAGLFLPGLLATPVVILLRNCRSRSRRVWVIPGARAVLTAKRTPGGWKPDNASARPVGHRVAAPLLAQLCAYADATGAVLSSHAGNQQLAQLYANRYGCSVHRSRRGRPRVTRYPQPATTPGPAAPAPAPT